MRIKQLISGATKIPNKNEIPTTSQKSQIDDGILVTQNENIENVFSPS